MILNHIKQYPIQAKRFLDQQQLKFYVKIFYSGDYHNINSRIIQSMKSQQFDTFRKTAQNILQLQQPRSSEESAMAQIESYIDYYQYFEDVLDNFDFNLIRQQCETSENLRMHSIQIIDLLPANQKSNLCSISQFYIKVRKQSMEGRYMIYDVFISRYVLEITLLNLHEDNLNQISDLGQGTYGKVRKQNIANKNFAVKMQLFGNQVLRKIGLSLHKTQINLVIREYSLHKICSLYKIGPNIINYLGFDIICHNNSIQFAMELCDSSIKVTSIKELKFLERQLKVILLTFHCLNIIHKDIKPSNILYSNTQGRFVFIDFGLSQVVANNITERTYTFYEGTEKFMSANMKQLKGKEFGNLNLYHNDYHGLDVTFGQIQKQMEKTRIEEMPDSQQYTQQSNNMYDMNGLQDQSGDASCPSEKKLIDYTFILIQYKIYKRQPLSHYLLDYVNNLRYSQLNLLYFLILDKPQYGTLLPKVKSLLQSQPKQLFPPQENLRHKINNLIRTKGLVPQIIDLYQTFEQDTKKQQILRKFVQAKQQQLLPVDIVRCFNLGDHERYQQILESKLRYQLANNPDQNQVLQIYLRLGLSGKNIEQSLLAHSFKNQVNQRKKQLYLSIVRLEKDFSFFSDVTHILHSYHKQFLNSKSQYFSIYMYFIETLVRNHFYTLAESILHNLHKVFTINPNQDIMYYNYYLTLASVSRKIKKFKQASQNVQMCNKMLKIHCPLQNFRKIAVYHENSKLLQAQDNYQQAQKILLEALTLNQLIYKDHPLTKFKLNSSLLMVNIRLGNFDQAKKYYDHNLANLSRFEDHKLIAAQFLNYSGLFFYSKGDYKQAITHMTKALNIYNIYPHLSHHRAFLNQNLALAHYSTSCYSVALQDANRAIHNYKMYFKLQKVKTEQVAVLYRLKANIYLSRGQIRLAQHQTSLLFKICQNRANELTAEYYLLVCKINLNLKLLNESLSNGHKSLEIYHQIYGNHHIFYQRVLQTIYWIQFKMGKREQSVFNLKGCIHTINKRFGAYHSNSIGGYILLSQMLCRLKKNKQSRAFIAKALMAILKQQNCHLEIHTADAYVQLCNVNNKTKLKLFNLCYSKILYCLSKILHIDFISRIDHSASQELLLSGDNQSNAAEFIHYKKRLRAFFRWQLLGRILALKHHLKTTYQVYNYPGNDYIYTILELHLIYSILNKAEQAERYLQRLREEIKIIKISNNYSQVIENYLRLN